MKVFFFVFLLAIAHVSLLSTSVIPMNPNTGFSMKMIPIHSKESPLYIGDHLTQVEMLHRLVEQSKARVLYIESQILLQSKSTRSMNPDDVRLPVIYEESGLYVAKVCLGTFLGTPTFMEYYLMVDTGSDLTWLQCEDANKTFNQDAQLYPWKLSSTYSPVPCDSHPLCSGDNCNDAGECTYSKRYAGGSFTYGITATEKFNFGPGGPEDIELRIGCGFYQEKFQAGENRLKGKPDLIAGILGLGIGQWSFINQLGAVGQGKFSYCLNQGSSTYLRFGADATIRGAFQEVYITPIETSYPSALYYLNLEDISVGKQRVRFSRGTFKLVVLADGRKKGGAIIDSGSTLSMLHKDHFDRVADLVKAHFNGLGAEYIGSQNGFDVCFHQPGSFDISNFPSITLHFQGAKYVIQDDKANFMLLSPEIACLGIIKGSSNQPGYKGPTFILGALQQTNKRILYDLVDESLSFATEHCELDS